MNRRSGRQRILVVVGTRPEAIKMGPVVRALRAAPDRFDVHVAAVTQQGEILERALAESGLSVERRVSVADAGDAIAPVLGAMVGPLAECVRAVAADRVIVHGDTTTSLAGALAGVYGSARVAHVEAGLRSGDRDDPFPEELHRALVDRIASVHYAPTPHARDNLLREGVAGGSVAVVGNPGIDALVEVLGGSPARAEPSAHPSILVTGHRRENFGERTRSVCEALRAIAVARDAVEITYVLHPHPRASGPAREVLGRIGRVTLVEPVGHAEFLALLRRASVVVTDSGGVQEEAAFLGRPTLVTRENTERVEAVEAGVAKVVGTDTARLVAELGVLLDDRAEHARRARPTAVFGDGCAADRIARDLATRA